MKTGLVVCGGITVVIGIGALIAGGMVKNSIIGQVEDGINAASIWTEPDDETTTETSTVSYTFFNYTNAEDIITGSVPVVQEVTIEFTQTSVTYDCEHNEADGTYGCHSFSYMDYKDPADANTMITTVNAVWAGAMTSVAGSEMAFNTNFPAGVLPSVVAGQTSACSALQINLVPYYVAGILGNLAGILAGFFGAQSMDVAIIQWSNRSAVPGEPFGGLEFGAPGFANNPALLGWELQEAVDPAVAGHLFDATFSHGWLNATAMSSVWMPALLACAENAYGSTCASSYFAASAAWTAAGSAMSVGDYGILMEYIGGRLDDASVFGIFAGNPASPIYDAATLGAADWGDISYLQTSHGFITQAMSMGNTIGALVGKPALEFYAYQVDVLGTAVGDVVYLTLNQTKAFYATFTQDNMAALLLMTAGSCLAGGPCNLTPFAATGLTLPTLGLYVNYLLRYVPHTLAIPTFLYDEAGESRNTGIFSTHTALELLYGYEDYLYDAIGRDQTHTGFMGPRVNTTAQHAATSPTKTFYKTGEKDVAAAGDMVSVGTVTEFDLLSDLGRDCPNPAIHYYDAQAVACDVWPGSEKVQIAGQKFLRTPPGTDKTLEGMPDEMQFYLGPFKRDFILTRDGTSTTLDVEMARYVLKDSEIKPAGTDGLSDAEEARAVKYRMEHEGFFDMSTFVGMVPMFQGFYRHSLNDHERGKISGLTTADWEADDADLSDFHADVQPHLGRPMNAKLTFQTNIKLDSRAFNGYFGQNMYLGGADEYVFMPLFYTSQGGVLDAGQAASVAMVLAGLAAGPMLNTVCLVVGVVFLLLGLACVGMGFKGGAEVAPTSG